MPYSLLQQLKKISEEEHCLDVSEATRSILRRRMTERKTPQKDKNQELAKKRILKKLKDLSEELSEFGDADAQ